MKKGFTLIELLAVIVIVAVIGLIVTPIVLNNVEQSRISAYRSSVQNVMEASKEYVSKNYKNHDFPKSGIDIPKTNLSLKNDEFKSGKIIRNKDEEIEAVNVYDGTYCAKGLKNHLIVEKVSNKEDCNNIDASAPRIKKLIVSIKTNNTITVMTILEAGETNIKEYEYCIGDDCKVSREKSFKFTGLKKDTEYLITVKVRNNNYKKSEQYSDSITQSEEKIKVRTENIEVPKINVSSISYAGSKKVIINYSKTKDKHENKYFIYDDKNNKILEENTDRNEISFNINKNGKVVAQTIVNDELYTSELKVIGIDNEGPVLNIEVKKDANTWTRQKTISLSVSDSSGLPKNAYSYNNGKTWTSSSIKTVSNRNVAIAVRDKLGNITKNNYVVAYLDDIAPTCNSTKTSVNNPNGVSVTFTCVDNDSGVKECTSAKSSIKNNASYEIQDNVGNKATCSVSVASKTQYRKRACATGRACVSAGCALYNSCRNSACGIEQYKYCCKTNSCRTPGCGVESYNYCCVNTSCALTRCTLYARCKVCDNCYGSRNCLMTTADNARCRANGGTPGAKSCCRTIRDSSCGTESASGSACNGARSAYCAQYNKSCGNQSTCGVASYNYCQNSACGQTCGRNSSCGIESYRSCRTAACGCQSYNRNATVCGCETWGGYTGWSDSGSNYCANSNTCQGQTRIVYY